MKLEKLKEIIEQVIFKELKEYGLVVDLDETSYFYDWGSVHKKEEKKIAILEEKINKLEELTGHKADDYEWETTTVQLNGDEPEVTKRKLVKKEKEE